MRQSTQKEYESIGSANQSAELDLVIPFTTPELTRVAVDAANRMGAGLNATLRLVRVQVVPYPLDLKQSPVYIDFLKSQLARIPSERPISGEVRLARELESGLLSTLRSDSVVILAARKRLWRTRSERLAAWLRRAGHKVVLVNQEATNA